MSTDIESRVIHLSLRKPFFENYLRFIFNSPEGRIKVSRCEELGKQLYSRVRYTSIPCKPPKGSHVVQLILPHHETDMSDKHFISYTEDDMVRLNDFIESSAKQDFKSCVQVGIEDLSINRKVIINLFSNLIFGDDKFEMLKKEEYRRRKKFEDWIVKSAQEYGY